jgi:hypothetical protein
VVALSGSRQRSVTYGGDVLIAGVPRGGTTLACELLNLVDDTVALDEPLYRPAVIERGRSGIVDLIRRFCEHQRRSLSERREAITVHVGGRVSATKLSRERNVRGDRVMLAKKGTVSFDKPLSPEFLLVVKHPTMFTAMLEVLVPSFQVFAVIRHPLSVLASWQTVPFAALRDGHLPMTEVLDPGLRARLARIDDPVDRQLLLLDWIFGRYRSRLPEHRVLRYEDLVASGGAVLVAITERARVLDEPLTNCNRAYDRVQMRALAARLLSTDGAYWAFYPRSSVMELLDS